jgi:hypothetical protein
MKCHSVERPYANIIFEFLCTPAFALRISVRPTLHCGVVHCWNRFSFDFHVQNSEQTVTALHSDVDPLVLEGKLGWAIRLSVDGNVCLFGLSDPAMSSAMRMPSELRPKSCGKVSFTNFETARKIETATVRQIWYSPSRILDEGTENSQRHPRASPRG